VVQRASDAKRAAVYFAPIVTVTSTFDHLTSKSHFESHLPPVPEFFGMLLFSCVSPLWDRRRNNFHVFQLNKSPDI